jgi:hypothetical protein
MFNEMADYTRYEMISIGDRRVYPKKIYTLQSERDYPGK